MPLSETTRKLIELAKVKAKAPEFLAATAHRRKPKPAVEPQVEKPADPPAPKK